MIRLAAVGTSHITDLFLEAAALTGQYILTAVVSRDEARGRAMLERHAAVAGEGARVYPNVEALCQGGAAQAVYIASPNGLHPSQSRLCLEAGLHVICEKPIVTRAEEFAALCRLAKERSLVYMEAIIPPYTEGREILLDGLSKIAPLTEVRLDYSQYSSRLDDFMAGKMSNVFDMSMHGGTLMDLGIYCVWGAIDLLGAPLGVSAASATYLAGGVDGAGSATLTYPGFSCHLSYTKTRQGEEGSIFKGENGTLTLSMISLYTGARLTLKNGESREILGSAPRTHLMSGEANAFARFIQSPSESKAEYERTVQATKAAHSVMDQIKKQAGIVYPTRTK